MESIKTRIIALAASVFFSMCSHPPHSSFPEGEAERGFRLIEKLDVSKISGGKGEYTHYMPINLIAVNPNIFHSFGENDLKKIVYYSREVFDQCGIEVRATTAQSYQGPKEYNRIDRSRDDVWGISAQEERLLSSFHKKNEITFYLVRAIRSKKGPGSSCSIRDADALGYDKRYSGTIYLLHGEMPLAIWYGKFVPAHEIGHIVFNENHLIDSLIPNIMAGGQRSLSFYVTPKQCEKARNSRFVRKINPPKPAHPIKIPRKLTHK